MGEGARRHLAQTAENAVVGVRQLDEGHVGGEVEGFLHQCHEWVGHQRQDAVEEEADIPLGFAPCRHKAEGLHELFYIIGYRHGQGHENGGLEQLGAARHVLQAVDGHHAAHKLSGEELEGIGEHDGADDEQGDVGDEGGARIEEHPCHDGYDGEGKYVDIDGGIALKEQCHQRKDEQQRVEEQHVAQLHGVVFLEEVQVDGEQAQEEHHKKCLSQTLGKHLLADELLALQFLLKRLQLQIGGLVHYLAVVYNLLAFGHIARIACYGGEHVFQLGLAFLLVALQVGHQILFYAERLEGLLLLLDVLVHEELVVEMAQHPQVVDVGGEHGLRLAFGLYHAYLRAAGHLRLLVVGNHPFRVERMQTAFQRVDKCQQLGLLALLDGGRNVGRHFVGGVLVEVIIGFELLQDAEAVGPHVFL